MLEDSQNEIKSKWLDDEILLASNIAKADHLNPEVLLQLGSR
jgi:hypothetical protein